VKIQKVVCENPKSGHVTKKIFHIGFPLQNKMKPQTFSFLQSKKKLALVYFIIKVNLHKNHHAKRTKESTFLWKPYHGAISKRFNLVLRVIAMSMMVSHPN